MPLKIYYLDDEEALYEIFEDYFSSEAVEVTTGDEVAKVMAASIPKYLITGGIRIVRRK
jgi:hypothetical protein